MKIGNFEQHLPGWIELAPTQEHMDRICKELNIDPVLPFVEPGHSGTCHCIDTSEGPCCIIGQDFHPDRRQILSSLAHEACHAWQFLSQTLPDEWKHHDEYMPTAIQTMMFWLLTEYAAHIALDREDRERRGWPATPDEAFKPTARKEDEQ